MRTIRHECVKIRMGPHERLNQRVTIQESRHQPRSQSEHGSSRITVVPPLGGQSMAMLPPWVSMNRLAVDKPNPVPRAFVVKNGVKSFSRTVGEIPGPVSAMSIRHFASIDVTVI